MPKRAPQMQVVAVDYTGIDNLEEVISRLIKYVCSQNGQGVSGTCSITRRSELLRMLKGNVYIISAA